MSSILLLDFVFWIFVGVSCVKDAVSCLETATLDHTFLFALVFDSTALGDLFTSIFAITISYILPYYFGCFSWVYFQKKSFKRMASIGISFVIVIGLSFGFGYIGFQQEMESSTMTKFIAITTIEDGFLNYVDAEVGDSDLMVLV